MRISIIGHASSGKTTLADKISKKLSIPHIHLDRFWFEAGGRDINRNTSDQERERVREYIRVNVLKSIASDSWVSDGFFSRMQPEISNKADVVIFLKIPLWRRLLNHLQRILKPVSRHKELSAWHEFTFFFEIVRRNFAFKPKFDEFLPKFKDKIIFYYRFFKKFY